MMLDSCQMTIIDLAEWVKEELESQKKTQAWLARKSGVGSATISRLVNMERMPVPESLVAISRALGYPPDYAIQKAMTQLYQDDARISEVVAAYKLEELSDTQLDEVIQFIEFIQSRDERNLDRRTSYKISREGEAPPEVIKE